MKTLVTSILIVFSTVLHAQIITTIAGNGTPGFSGEGGLAINAEFNFPAGVATDKYGNIYIADFYNQVVQKIDTNGILTRFAGTGAGYSSGTNGTPASSTPIGLDDIVGIAVDTAGNVYFPDGSTVRQVNTSGIITTIAGNGIYGYAGDDSAATNAKLAAPEGLCFDKAGNLYIADAQNNNIRKVNRSGIISTFAGIGTLGYSGNGGPATNAQLKWPEGIAFDNIGNMYIADSYNYRVRKIDTANIITTIAGGDTLPFITCDGCPATNLQLNAPIGIAVDNNGNVYTAVIVSSVIQKITADGLAYTIAGRGTQGYSGDGGPASNAMLSTPNMICLDNAGNLLIADKDNVRYRKIWLNPTSIPHIQPGSVRFSVYPNPVTNHYLTCTITADTYDVATIAIRDILGQEVFRSRCLTNNATGFTIDVPPGLYFITAYATSGTIVEKLVVE